MKDHTKPAFALFKEFLGTLIFVLVFIPVALFYLFALFMDWLSRK